MQIGCALRIDFLVALIFELNLWKWKTREEVIYFIQNVTPHYNTIRSGSGSGGGEGDAVRAASRAAWPLAKGAAAGGRGGARKEWKRRRCVCHRFEAGYEREHTSCKGSSCSSICCYVVYNVPPLFPCPLYHKKINKKSGEIISMKIHINLQFDFLIRPSPRYRCVFYHRRFFLPIMFE